MICAKQYNLDLPSFTHFQLYIKTTIGEHKSPIFDIDRLKAIKEEGV